jgi:hypothetical protein
VHAAGGNATHRLVSRQIAPSIVVAQWQGGAVVAALQQVGAVQKQRTRASHGSLGTVKRERGQGGLVRRSVWQGGQSHAGDGLGRSRGGTLLGGFP